MGNGIRSDILGHIFDVLGQAGLLPGRWRWGLVSEGCAVAVEAGLGILCMVWIFGRHKNSTNETSQSACRPPMEMKNGTPQRTRNACRRGTPNA